MSDEPLQPSQEARDYQREALDDELHDILRPFHWEAWKASLFDNHPDGWPDEDEQEFIVRAVDSVAVGEHYEAWATEVRDKIVAALASPPSSDGLREALQAMVDRFGHVACMQVGQAKLALSTNPSSPEAVGEAVAWAERDGDDWLVHDAESQVGKHIALYQKDHHYKTLFPVYRHPVAADRGRLIEASLFLLDRLVDHEVRMTSDEDAREWMGHVTPAMERFRAALSPKGAGKEGRRGSLKAASSTTT